MLTYIAILVLGLIGIYRIRYALLAMQRKKNEAAELSINIIPEETPQCKHFKKAG